MEPGTILAQPRKIVDLNLPRHGNSSLEERLTAAIKLGFNVFALNTFVPSSGAPPAGKKRGKKQQSGASAISAYDVPPAPPIPDFARKIARPVAPGLLAANDNGQSDGPAAKRRRFGKIGTDQEGGGDEPGPTGFERDQIHFLNRITVELKTQDDTLKLKRNSNIKSYDIIAVVPRTPELLKTACQQLDCDIIVLEQPTGTDRRCLIPNRGSAAESVARGIHFELNYAPLVRPGAHQQFIPLFFNAIHLLTSNLSHCANLKSTTPNIVLSSGGGGKDDFRSQNDQVNVLDLFDLDEAKAKVIVTKHPLRVLVHAFQRKTSKSAVFVEKLATEIIVPAPETDDGKGSNVVPAEETNASKKETGDAPRVEAV